MPSSSSTRSNQFSSRLHDMLDEAEKMGHDNIISWCPDGKSFNIHLPGAMVPVLATYFRQTKYKSLLRQLQGYSFKRVTSGEKKGNVSHPSFVRGRRTMCMRMKRKKTRSSIKASTQASISNGTSNTNDDNDKIATSTTKDLQACTRDSTNSIRVARVSSLSGIVDVSVPVEVSSCNNDISQGSPHHPRVISSTCIRLNPLITQSNEKDLQQLESNYQKSMNNAFLQAPNQHQVTTILTVPPIVGHNEVCQHHHQNRHHQQATGIDALRVEIGCAFSSPKNDNNRMISASSSSCLKRNAHQQHHQHVIQGSASAPSFESARFSKRRRSYNENAPFPISMMGGSQQAQDDTILTEEKLQLEKSQQQKEFEKLERLCFSNLPQGPGTQQFQHSHNAIGALDLDISLTTTTTTTHHNGGDPQVSSSMIDNKFVLLSQLEPTPIMSPRRQFVTNSCSASNGFTMNFDVDFPSKVENNNNNNNNNNKNFQDVIFKFPSAPTAQANPTADWKSTRGQSHRINEGIAEAYDSAWPSATFGSNREDCEEIQDDWTKGIVYDGKADCVLEPELFQVEVRSLLPGSQHQQLRQHLQHGHQQPTRQQHHFLQQAIMYQQGNINRRSQHIQVPQASFRPSPYTAISTNGSYPSVTLETGGIPTQQLK